MEASGQTGAPTAEEMAKAGEVSVAAAEAVEGAQTEQEARERARAAVRSKSDEVKLELSDDDCNRIVDMLIDRMSALGAFDPPPPPAAAPAPPQPAAPASGSETPAAPAEAPVEPKKRSFAERFAGE